MAGRVYVIPKLTSLYMLSSLLNLLYNTRLFPMLDLHSLMIYSLDVNKLGTFFLNLFW